VSFYIIGIITTFFVGALAGFTSLILGLAYAPWVKALLVALVLAVLAGLTALFVYFYRKRQAANEESASAKKAPDPRASASRVRRNAAFSSAMRRLDGTGTGWDQRYRVPWCLLVGEPGSGRSSLLRSIELHRPFGAPDQDSIPPGECVFWFFDRGLVLDVPITADPTDDRWPAVMQSVRRARRQRPIDSVVLTIPATDLAGPMKLDPAALRSKADGLYRAVRRLQEELGVLFPVYVVVTKTDTVPGFAESCRALPVSAWEEMFGWSSPHSFETPYSTEWVTQAFNIVNATIAQTQMDLLAASPAELKDPDAVYTLPSEFSALEAPLKLLVDQIFKPTSYHEPFALRGIYFAGDPNLPESAPSIGMDGAVVPAELGPEGRRPIFTTQLFESKVFAERGLARPAARSKVGNRRAILTLQYSLATIAILAPIGLWSAYSSVTRKVTPIADATTVISSMLSEVRAAKDAAPAKPIDADEIKRRAADTMQAVSRIHAEHLWQWQLPTTWFSSIDLSLRQALRRTFEDIVLFSYFQALQQKRTSLLGQSESATAAANRPRVVAPANMPEFQALQTIDKELQAFSNYVGEYNDLSKSTESQKLDAVNHLAKYLLSLNLGPTFLENGPIYRDSLKNVSYIAFDGVASAKVQEAAASLSTSMTRRVFQENPVEQDMKDLVQQLGDLEASNAELDLMVAAVRRLTDTIARTKSDLASPEMAWLAAEDLGEPFVGLLGSIRQSNVLGTSMVTSFDDRWHTEYKEMRRRLFSYSPGATGPLLATALVNGKLVLTEKVIQVEDALNTFLAQPFVKVDRTETVALVPSTGDVRILWSADSLDKATKLAEPFEAYVHTKLETAPEHLRSLLEELAKEEFEAAVRHLVQKAQRALVSASSSRDSAESQAKSEMSTELSSLKRVVTQIKGLVDIDDKYELTAAGTDLRRQVSAQAQSLLRRVDTLLEQGELYTPDAKLEQWAGVRPPALEAFDLAGADALGQYLRTQRTRVSELARDFAAIPVQLLEVVVSGSGAPALLSKWQRINTELQQRESMQPGNSVQGLEAFIQTDMIELTRDNCLGRLPKRSSEGGDFFLAKLATLRNTLRRRCEALNGTKLLAKYDSLANTFNETLAGHFPFAAEEAETAEGDASPHDITKLLREYDAYMPEFEAFKAQSDRTMTNGAWGPFTRDMLMFLNQLKDVRRFFQPILSQDGVDVTPRYGLRLVPRVNRTREFKANQIIQWDLLLSGQRVDVKQAMWSLGDPVRVSFRWAKDAPFMPSRDGQPKNVQVTEDDAVQFDYGGSWSLLRLLRSQQAPTTDLDGGVDQKPHTLEFLIKIEDRPTGDEPYSETVQREKARAFVRLSLTAPDGITRIVAPKFWPTRAPQVISAGPLTPSGVAEKKPDQASGEDDDGSGTGDAIPPAANEAAGKTEGQ
jgi:type VI protein secretion system component VasK